ncbi:GntR family transcriptional regulator [Alsobacter soli]|nr:GntR family transcriptional regulator [Alsobacter soli]
MIIIAPEAAQERLHLGPLDTSVSLRTRAYAAIKTAIASMDIYGHAREIRVDERRLSEDLGISRTPIREALAHLENEGLVRSVPRKGVFIVRKSRDEIIEMITVWAALESMAARLAALHAHDDDLESLATRFGGLVAEPDDAVGEYSDANIAFHQSIIRLSGSRLLEEMTRNLFLHVRAIRVAALRQNRRIFTSISEHEAIIAALLARDADRAETLVREHTLGLAAHVQFHWGEPGGGDVHQQAAPV